jgi:endoglucanase
MRRVARIPLAFALASGACGASAGGRAGDGAFSPIDMGGCTRAAVIEDAENADHQVVVHEGRGGYIYAFVDEAGSSVTPTAGRLGGTFSQSEGGANGSMYAARVNGRIGEGTVVFAGVGLNFLDPKAPYDASAYDGIAFFARRGPDSTANVRLKVPDASTDPDARVCTECFNDFGADLEIGEQWRQYTVPFQQMAQMPGWGAPRPGSVDRSKLFGVQWQIATPGASYDLWIDDVVFYGCSR